MKLGRLTAGSPEPLGVTPAPGGINIAVPSATASAIDLCLFDSDGREHRIRLAERTGEVFHGHLEGVRAGARYGLRAHGPFDPARGLRFDATKLLVDPYARALDAPFRLHPALFTPPEAGVDSAAFVPKALIGAPAARPARTPLTVPWDRTVIYEAHVRGLTKLHPKVPDAIRGTFAALAHPAVIEHLARLGVTTLELMPAAAWIDERQLPPLGLANYWGYNPIAFCAPDLRLAPGGWAEVRAAVEALNKAGIEVIQDVVFNHTGEGDDLGPTLSLKGLDNPGYYRLDPADPGRYRNEAGTGNTLACDAPQTVRLVMDALRTWARLGGVSGFRFDLATVLGRRGEGFDPAAPLIAAITQDPELRALKLIAEPWDLGPRGHQLGRFPAAFGEWNDHFRDTVRRFWGGHGASRGELAARLAGSQDAFGAKRRPSRSVNFVTAHDGFTLADLVSYAAKHNQANGEANRDGTDANWSWNHGVEGLNEDPSVKANRLADQRALLALTVLARGTPMLAMGAELGHSQDGNNNAYAQDNATSWIDWAAADADLAGFVGRLVQARAAHPALRHDGFLTGEAAAGPFHDVVWGDALGEGLTAAGWDDPDGPVLQMVLSAPDGDGLDRVALILNRGEAAVEARLPELRARGGWRIILDSADPGRQGEAAGETLPLAPRSVLLLAEAIDPRRKPRRADDGLVARVAGAAGIAPSWWGLDRRERPVTPQTQRALLAAMGFPAGGLDEARDSLWRLAAPGRAALPAGQVVRVGEAAAIEVRAPERWLTLTEQTGEVRRLPVEDGQVRLPELPPGRYALRLDSAEGALIVAPQAAFEPVSLAGGARLFGLSAQLYALRREGDQGVGDLATLAAFAETAARAGASLVAINPLHMLFPGDRTRASPYHPSDRRFLDPIYLDLAALGAGAPARSAAELIDYPAVWTAKAQALEAALAGGAEPEGFEALVRDGGPALARFALFQAIAETRPGQPWPAWPAGLRDPESRESARFARAHAARIRFHQRLQFEAERQLAAAAGRAPGVGLCRDLAVGAAGDGAEVWADPARWARGASIGAPPDAFAPQGQVWALPPPIPQARAAEGYLGFAELLGANMRHAGALRIDHILGLQRLFWVPDGAEGSDGAYVSYPLDDLLGVLALESVRAGCLVIGEDLGTVPEGLRARLAEARVYGYSVLPFERDGEAFRPPGAYRRKALACAATHDLPPLAGWWAGADLAERAALGLLTSEDLTSAQAGRRAEKAALIEAMGAAGLAGPWVADGPYTADLAAALHGFLAMAESQLVVIQAEDLAGEVVAQNVPGTDRERANWRRRIATPLEALGGAPLARRILEAVRAARPVG
ncbi:MAG TPA: glycogen debranching protein GlgX [Phenylobacterium sp.]|uniref:glycogen debranching protein GlgX n=1 Tax=Phenylobacterium sp. TaxID=1871053 RepID=UPI002CB805BD|nr:glycogen debranching protein GlgX [Phenylobacterium sp.]HSV02869.1 glycogen debranching protein GlgX [Phenylobacterium sp.]